MTYQGDIKGILDLKYMRLPLHWQRNISPLEESEQKVTRSPEKLKVSDVVSINIHCSPFGIQSGNKDLESLNFPFLTVLYWRTL